MGAAVVRGGRADVDEGREGSRLGGGVRRRECTRE